MADIISVKSVGAIFYLKKKRIRATHCPLDSYMFDIWPKMVNTVKNGQKRTKTVNTSQKLSTMVNTVQNGKKWSKTVHND